MATGQTWHNAYSPTEDRLEKILDRLLTSGNPVKVNLSPNKWGTGWQMGWSFDTNVTEIKIFDKAYVAPSTEVSTTVQNPGEPF